MTPLERMLDHDEGNRLKPYFCSKHKLSIGRGRNLEDRGISQDESVLMFTNDIRIARTDASGFDWYHRLSPVRQDVITMMLFNLGLPKFVEFKRMIHSLSLGDTGAAATEMMNSEWAREVPERAHRLSEMMLRNKYPEEIIDGHGS